MSKIWRNIGLREHKSGGKTDGFIVTFVKKGSVFAQLGMRKNDILIEANGYKLTSYKDALKIYKQIDTIKTFKLTVLRNNEEKELEYDIY
jgi:general secretion pathway protein C